MLGSLPIDPASQILLVRKTASFFEFFLCLSRACLGKMIVLIYKWLKNAVFRRAYGSILHHDVSLSW
jgi:hypothetical protein